MVMGFTVSREKVLNKEMLSCGSIGDVALDQVEY